MDYLDQKGTTQLKSYAHFILLKHTYNAVVAATVFLKEVVRHMAFLKASCRIETKCLLVYS